MPRELHGAARKHEHAREYDVWIAMKGRCDNHQHRHYARYGGRGIAVCDRWRDYRAFIADLGPCPLGYTLERRNNDGGYTPDNCYWASRETQSNNRVANRRITFNDETLTLAQWARRLGITSSVLRSRLNAWSMERALTTARQPRSTLLAFNGETLSLAEWSRRYGLSEETVRSRVNDGWTLSRALTTQPLHPHHRVTT